MSLSTLAALLLALAVLAATARQLARWLRLPGDARPARWRMATLLALQAACAALLYCTLLPPQRAVERTTLVVLTADADAVAGRAPVGRADVVVALPEAAGEAAREATRMPDLATALRLHPDVSGLRVVGAGLVARDLGAATGRAIAFEAAPLPRGFVELQSPPRVVAGGPLRVAGRVHDVADGLVELLDPAGVVQDRVQPDADGRFLLQDATRAPGPAAWRLRLRLREGAAADAATIEEVDIPVDAVRGEGTRLLLLGGAPNPELKYLRRWAADAGLALRSRMALGAGVTLGDAPVALDASTLAGFDLAIVDERAWAGLGSGPRAALLDAVDEGLGLMLRITAPLDATSRAALRDLGFAVGAAGAEPAVPVHLDPDQPIPAGRAREAAAGATAVAPPLARQPLQFDAPGAVPLLRDRDGAPLAVWRAAGRGRIAAWNLDQSFRLVLAGYGDRHARLWSEAVGTLARARGHAPPRFAGVARAGERAILCGVAAGSVLVADDGTRLHPVPHPAADGCAAVWPTRPGWHRIGEGDDAVHLHVRDAASLPGVEARSRRDATLQQAGPGDGSHGAAAASPAGAGRGSWFLAWLAASGLLWWLERSRHGRQAGLPARGTASGAD